jgi:hypothetical protein
MEGGEAGWRGFEWAEEMTATADGAGPLVSLSPFSFGVVASSLSSYLARGRGPVLPAVAGQSARLCTVASFFRCGSDASSLSYRLVIVIFPAPLLYLCPPFLPRALSPPPSPAPSTPSLRPHDFTASLHHISPCHR